MSTPRSSVNFAASDTSLVSPIETTFNLPPQRTPQPDHQPPSAIPRPTNLPRPTHQTPSQTKPNRDQTKWDDYSGEPTTADTGKPASVRPGAQQPLEMQYPQLKERTKQILAGLRDRGGASQKSTWGKAPPPVAADPLDHPPAPKEPWRGASGREAIVAPVKNTAAARTGPLKHPQRNVSKMDPIQDMARTASPDIDRGASPDPAPGQVYNRTYATTQPAAKPSPRPDLSIRVVPEHEIKPTAPLKVKSPRLRSPTEAENAASLHTSLRSPQASQQTNHPAPLKQREDTQTRIDPPQPLASTAGNTYSRAHETPPNPGMSHIPYEPVSHLSWTTYATTTNESPDSLRGHDPESSPVPPLPQVNSPLIMRKRPVSTAANALPFSNPDAAGSRASVISRKPIPAGLDRARSGSVFSTASATKSLPPTPIEMNAVDKITTLEARLEDLAMRRRNNRKLIWEMQEDLKRNTIAYDTRKRMNVEKQITNLEQDLTDIGREEHEVGLQLHRAQKKRDRENCYENPTGLWIKRVTT
jgi:hypothetical protein